MLTSFLMLIVAGCGQSYQPAAQSQTVALEPAADSAQIATLDAEPHAGLPVVDPHSGLPSGDPHAGLIGMPAVAAAEGPPPEGGDLDLGTIRLKAPDSWKRQQPRSGFVAAEFLLPRAEGDSADGRLTISTAGGSVTANIDRWRGQFGGKPDKESKDEVPIAGSTVTVVDFTGTFLDQPGPFAPGVKREGYRMLGAIIPVGDQLHFVKAYGPDKTMAAQVSAFQAFLKTLQIK
jgi:hypothetical protein